MRTVIVRYKTLAEHADTNEQLVRAVFADLARRTPVQVTYASYRLADRVSFVHIATVASESENPLTSLPAFKTFQLALRDRCAEPPVVTEMSQVGAYASAS